MLKFDNAQIPLLLFIAAVLNALMSGNDKAPFAVMLTLIISLVFSLGVFVSTLIAKRGVKAAATRAAIALSPVLYALLVFYLDARDIIDAVNFIGFR